MRWLQLCNKAFSTVWHFIDIVKTRRGKCTLGRGRNKKWVSLKSMPGACLLCVRVFNRLAIRAALIFSVEEIEATVHTEV
jgi:hypothetical protein